MMKTEDRYIFDKFATCIKAKYANAKIWIYGSRARGDAQWDSDFDLFIVLEHVNNDIDQWIREKAWEISFDNNCVLTTIVIDREQFENGPMSESSLVKNILSEGVAA